MHPAAACRPLALGIAALTLALGVGCSDDDATGESSTGGGGGGGGGGSGAGASGGAGGGGAGGGGAGGEGGVTFASSRVYVHALFATPEECEAFQQQGGNCDQVVQFCPSGDAAILVTDIVNVGTYVVEGLADGLGEGDSIVTSWPSGDVAPTVVFTVATDARLVDEADGAWDLSADAGAALIACP